MLAKRPSRLFLIWFVIGCDVAITVSKFAGAFFSGSSALMSEAAHTFVDVSIGFLLLYGEHRAKRPADAEHPFGHGREIYFWSFLVSLLMFSGGAVVAIYTGVRSIMAPAPLEDVWLAYAVLAVSGLFDSTSLLVARRRFAAEWRGRSLAAAVVASKDAPTFVVLLQDSAGVLGVFIAFAGTFLASRFGWLRADGAASCAIGVLLAATAFVLARESKQLLLGESAQPRVSRSILELARRERGVLEVHELHTIQLAPSQIVATLEVRFEQGLRTADIEAAVAGVEQRIRAAVPEIVGVFIHPARRDGGARQDPYSRSSKSSQDLSKADSASAR